jgi:hypothetical protein
VHKSLKIKIVTHKIVAKIASTYRKIHSTKHRTIPAKLRLFLFFDLKAHEICSPKQNDEAYFCVE